MWSNPEVVESKSGRIQRWSNPKVVEPKGGRTRRWSNPKVVEPNEAGGEQGPKKSYV